ncbi:MAG: amidohydrolase [Lachnospiraceae bacterium]|jgi:predicted amidohydrolase YtcJ|nr:amidohydrolase [Lachnospiraceae bacterium]
MDTLYYNGKIITMEEGDAPEAVLVRDGMIAFAGRLDDTRKAAGEELETVDLNGQCLMPSFIDTHSHIFMNGQMAMCAGLGDCRSYDDIISTLRRFIKEKQIGADGIVMGFGYDHNFLAEGGQPDKRVLDQVSTEIPIMILHVSAHLACVNRKALELAGITEATPDPQGGAIGRLEGSMEPSGYLEEAGMTLVKKSIAGRLKVNVHEILSSMQDIYIENGVTTAQDGATTESDLEALKMASSQGLLKMDVVSYPLLSSNGQELLHKNKDLYGTYRSHLKIGGYKIVLDGSPQGRSAWLSEPYRNGAPDDCGYPWMTDGQVETFVKLAVKERIQLLAHCNGDAASEQYLRAYDLALKETGGTEDLRPVMIHCQTVRSDQLARMAELGMIASFFVGHVFYWGDVHVKNLGVERGNHVSPVRDAIDLGVKVNFHQDTPVTPPDMLHSVWCAVNRISRNGAVIGADERISVYEALKAVTIDAAFEYFEEEDKGSIKAGKRADLVILDQSPLETAPSEIHKIKVMATIKDGEVIYRRK